MITRDYIDIMASALTEKTGVKVQAGEIWQADIKNKVLTYNKNDIASMEFDTAKGLLIHEMGHIKFTEDPTCEITTKYPHAGHEVINAFEDMRIEARLTGEFGNFARYPLIRLSTNSILNNFEIVKNDYSEVPKLRQFLHLALMSWETLRNETIRDIIGLYAQKTISGDPYYHGPRFDDEVIEAYRDNEGRINDVIDSTQSSHSTQSLSETLDADILPIIEKWLKEAEEEAKKSPKGEPKNGKDGEQLSTDKVQSMKDGGGTKSKITVAQKTPMEDVPEMARTMYEYGAIARTLGQRLKDILNERRGTKYSGNHASGRLLSKNAFKILNNESRIFSHKLPTQPDDYVFYFVIDSSGSMRGGKAYSALQAGQILQLALEPFGLPLKFYTFDETCEKLADLTKYEAIGGGTNDASVFTRLLDDFKDDGDAEKIVFLITDGETELEDERAELIAKIKKQHGIIYGMGIGSGVDSETIQENYDNPVYIPDLKNLAVELLRIMRATVTR